MLKHRTYSEVADGDTSGMIEQVVGQAEKVAERMKGVRACVAVMSGKGGVGKSLTTAGLAAACAARGCRVGLLDADLVGPSAARMSGVNAAGLLVFEDRIEPAVSASGVKVMSMELLLEEGAPLAWREPASESFVWRSAQERTALREFVSDIDWGVLDLLIVDLPPGTQRLIDLAEMLPRLDGVIVLTIPSAASEAAVDRSMKLARDRGIPILGVVENMAGYACETCGETRPLFPGNAGERLAERHAAPLLARVAFDPAAATLAEAGSLAAMLSSTDAGRAISRTADELLDLLEGLEGLDEIV